MAILIINTLPEAENVIWNLDPGGSKFQILEEGGGRVVVRFDGDELSSYEEWQLNTNPDVLLWSLAVEDSRSLTGY